MCRMPCQALQSFCFSATYVVVLWMAVSKTIMLVRVSKKRPQLRQLKMLLPHNSSMVCTLRYMTLGRNFSILQVIGFCKVKAGKEPEPSQVLLHHGLGFDKMLG